MIETARATIHALGEERRAQRRDDFNSGRMSPMSRSMYLKGMQRSIDDEEEITTGRIDEEIERAKARARRFARVEAYARRRAAAANARRIAVRHLIVGYRHRCRFSIDPFCRYRWTPLTVLTSVEPRLLQLRAW